MMRKVQSGFIGAVLICAMLWNAQLCFAQSGQIAVEKRLQRASNVVRVGEHLVFTISIRNNAAFPIEVLPLEDTFDSYILTYRDADPAPNTADEAGGRLFWNDLTATFGDLAPGQEIVVTVEFVVEHPTPGTVNAARVVGTVGGGSSDVHDDDDVNTDEVIGGAAPVEKVMGMPFAQVGAPISFTIYITNDSAATMTVLPIQDDYDSTALLYSHADPPPDAVNVAAGTLDWYDLTEHFGDIPGDAVVSITTYFTPIIPIAGAINQVAVRGARDQYNNDITPGYAPVPIVVIGVSTPTPTSSEPSEVPEGGTIWLVGSGVLVLSAWWRNRRLRG